MSLLDRQGLFYVLALLLVLAGGVLRSRRALPLALGAAAGGRVLVPVLQAPRPAADPALEGYWPSLPVPELRPERLLSLEPWRQAPASSATGRRCCSAACRRRC